ncbi:uncharacterized protein LOC125065157 isoform X1 [Vanessa atalanta]|uniref:uncharacterized protein LOC125065157 isoform X1 n=1 Tax=Vanessa atalanta TaxID=42275 RepID=UPI001FCE0939|nr:uncharacterized protein LOC125065157 isoform X1 [Vanessa atalanta]
MRCLIFLIPMLCFVNGRNLHDFDEDRDTDISDSIDLVKNIRDSNSNQMRHRRKSRQSYYDFSPYYYDNRREYVRHQDEMLNRIIRLLDEISLYVKRPPTPPPPPQVIYVPYPVPYPMPQVRPCTEKPAIVNLTDKWPDMDDINMNWGLVPEEIEEKDDGSDGARPVSFVPMETNESVPIPPPVEHGSSQAGMEASTKAPTVARPGICQAAIILCCNSGTKQTQQSCFNKYGCPKTFSTGLSCKPKIVKQVLEEFAKAYAPNSNR